MAVARLGYEIDSSGAVKAAFDLNAMAKASGTAEAASSGLEREFNKTMRTSNGAASGVLSLDAALGSTTKAISTTTSAATIFEAQVSGIGNEIARTAAESQIWQRELEQTRARFDPLFAASKRYEQELRDIAEAERMGAINANVAAQARDRASTAMNGGAVAATRFGGAMKVSSAHTANLGAQLNDIGVMLAAGQNPLQLAVQQGTQINQVFAQMGGGRQALRGLAAGFLSMINPMSLATIGIIAGGAALTQWAMSAWGAGDAANDLEGRMDDLSTIMGDVKDLTDILEMSVTDLSEEYGTAANRVREFAIAQAELTQAQSMSRLAEQFSILRGELDRYTVSLGEISGPGAMASVELQRNALSAIQRDFRVTADQALVLRDSLGALAAADTLENQQVALQGVLDDLEAMGVPLANIPADLQIAIDEMITLGRKTDAVTAAVSRLAEQTQFMAGLNPTMPLSFLLPPRQRDRGGRGGGGSRVDEFARDLERLRESLRTEREVVDEWYAQQQEILANRRAMEILGIEGHNQAKLRLEEEYLDRLRGINQGYQGSALDQAETFFGDMASALQGGNSKMIAAAQTFASIEALINAYRAYNQVIADPTLPWFAKIPAAAGVLAAGLRTVSSIKSLSGGSSGTSATAGVTATGASAPQQTRAIISLQGGRSRFTVEEINDITRQLQEQSDDGVIIEGFTRA